MEDARAQEEKQLEANADAYYADVARATEERLEKEAADTYGGKAPEETWSLFIAALEQEDAELAAKYFVVDKQGEALARFITAKQKGTLGKWIEILKLPRQNVTSENKEIFEFVSKTDNDEQFIYTLQINPQTHVWKILSL
jgi:hypothetical protein